MILAALLAVTTGPPAPVAVRRQTVSIRWDVQTRSCVSTVRGVDTGDVQSDTGKAGLAAALPDKGAELQVSGIGEVPYPCVADMIQSLQRAGYYGRISLTTGPQAAR